MERTASSRRLGVLSIATALMAATVGGTYVGLSTTTSTAQTAGQNTEQPGITQLHPQKQPPTDAIEQAHQRRDRMVESGVKKPRSSTTPPAAVQPTAPSTLVMQPAPAAPAITDAAQIPASTLIARRAKIDLDGNGVYNTNDDQTFTNEKAVINDWQIRTLRPTSLSATTSNPQSQSVTITWTQQAPLKSAAEPFGVTSIILDRSGTSITVPLGQTVITDTPGAGTWTYKIKNSTDLYEGEWTDPVTITLQGQVATGACCASDGSCSVVTAAQCSATNGIYRGDNVTCGAANCQPVTSIGWTDLTPPAGALVFYVSNSTGNDANPGTQAAPFKTPQKGLSMARNGQPDQVLLKCGDTWTLSDQLTLTKSANSTTKYMVLGSYGTGPRPKLIFPSHGIFGGNNSGQHNGFAISGLELQPAAITAQSDGIILLSTNGAAWEDVLIEDCYISKFSAGIVAQTLTDGHIFNNLKIRRCVIVDNDNNGGGHAQGIFLGGAVNWLIEGCVIDNNARSKNDMFCHNLYAHQLCGPGIFRDNISSRACSHGGQQRPGGLAENNLFMQNPINFYQGGNSELGAPYGGDIVNQFRNNIALDSRDINSTDRRGFGFVLAGAPGSVVENNIGAYQVNGTDAIDCYDFDDFKGAVRGNVSWDWDGPRAGNPGWCGAFHFEGGCQITSFANNTAVHHLNGMCIRWEIPFSGTYTGNTYWTATPDSGVGSYQRFSTNGGTGATWNQWQSIAHDNGTFMALAPSQPNGNIGDYLTSLGDNPGADPIVTFVTKARLRSRQNDDPRYTANGANTFIRGKFRVGVNP